MTAEISFDSRDLERLLASTIGEENARDVVRKTIGSLRFDARDLSREQALSVLEKIACEPGLVGITARLAKSRLRAAKLVAAARAT